VGVCWDDRGFLPFGAMTATQNRPPRMLTTHIGTESLGILIIAGPGCLIEVITEAISEIGTH